MDTNKRKQPQMYADDFNEEAVAISSQYYLRKSAVKLFSYSRQFVSIRGFLASIRGSHHWAEPSDDLGETSGYLAEGTVLDAVDQL
jgi:hypothetical protein